MINEGPSSSAAPARLAYLLVPAFIAITGFEVFQPGNLDDVPALFALLFAIVSLWVIMINAGIKTDKSQARLLVPLLGAVAVLMIYGLFNAANWQDGIGFVAVLLAAAAPALFWIRSGMMGVPILPAVSVLYIVYFGLSAMRGMGEEANYRPNQVVTACLSVAVFLMIATWVNFWVSVQPVRRRQMSASLLRFSDTQVVRLIYAGLGLGLLFYVGQFTGLLNWLGNFWGTLRSVAMSAMALASFLLGYAIARRILNGPNLLILCGALFALMVLSLSTLFLIGVVTIMLAALVGYTITARRIPWLLLAVAFLFLSIFQAGKEEVRNQHWIRHSNYSANTSLSHAPKVVSEWFVTGAGSLLSGTSQAGVIDRASLLNQLIRVEDWTPKYVPYLYGDTYTYLPSLLIPRFVSSDKPASQIVMNKLDIRYGFLPTYEVRYVAVGVNLLPEAFANFGYAGIVLIAIVFGLLTGLFTRMSIGRSPASLQVLLAITVFVTFTDLEADLSYLLTSLFQSLISVAIFFFAFQFMTEPIHRHAILRRAPESGRLRQPRGQLPQD